VVVIRRTGKGNRDQDLALALARIEAVFGPVQVLEVRPNPRPATRQRAQGDQARDDAAQTALDLDGQQQGGEAVA
jgi:hypothetical protein